MKKCINLIYLVLISPSLNAMDKTLDVTKWQEICKNPEKKQQLVTVYKDFCEKRFHKAIPGTVTSWTSLVAWGSCAVMKVPYSRSCPSIILGSLVAFYAIHKTRVLRCYSRLNQLAIQEDLSYLNHDVLAQLGDPKVTVHNKKGLVRGWYSDYDYDVMDKRTSANYQHPIKVYYEVFSIREIDGIKRALSGKYTTNSIDYDWNL